uniref:PEHE domain-containing protein n=1 Tax=Apteryx owenii TaxID=8824 RepID=A0A8B9PB09_APTOW
MRRGAGCRRAPGAAGGPAPFNALPFRSAVPSWRDHVVEPLRDPNPSDLLENLDDSVFSKRHAKLELDEKRRKRWDIQRIREQRILQRLQLRMYKRKGIQESEPEVTSFFPEPDDVESLLITPYLPVVAFGRPLPKLTPQAGCRRGARHEPPGCPSGGERPRPAPHPKRSKLLPIRGATL